MVLRAPRLVSKQLLQFALPLRNETWLRVLRAIRGCITKELGPETTETMGITAGFGGVGSRQVDVR